MVSSVGRFANWEKGGAERRAESLAESKLTAEQIKDLVNRRADLEKQGFAAQDSRQATLDATALSNKNLDRREDFQIAQQGRNQAFELDKLGKMQAGTDARADERAKNADERADDVASRPYNKDIYEQQKAAKDVERRATGLVQLIDKIDPKGDETIASAVARAAKAGLVKDSDAAQLMREHSLFIFSNLKPTFPGSLSDQERAAMQGAMAGDLGVPASTLKKVILKAGNNAFEKANEAHELATAAKYKINFPALENPYAQKSEAAPTVPTREQFKTPQEYLTALTEYNKSH